ncbi:SMI1/KNR4 family protein [Marinobacter sp. DUT-1]|uniref:SMI1/KNR4 family protein n=1 Tax=Marinobacter sp. DUT-1 TaxID=3412037 RepID=UPI003D176866
MERQVLARGGQRNKPASETAIAEAEQRLGTELPESLKDFWRASNGLMHLRLDADDGLIHGVDTVSWLKSSNPDFIPERSRTKIILSMGLTRTPYTCVMVTSNPCS